VIPRLYAIVDVEVCAARRLDPASVAAAFAAGGARLLQLRDKRPSSADRLTLTLGVRSAIDRVSLIVNDRADIARLGGADGVHVGQDDLPVDAVRALLGADALIGVSTHAPEQIDAALRTSADYIAVGPIFATHTKDTGYTPRGLDLVRRAADACAGRRPVVAIGGITLESAAEVIRAGADAVAVITDLVSGDPEQQTRRFLDALHSA
jgi:thiamine-phosphate pyrophosphorylase